MEKEFSLSRGNAMINFTVKYCDTPEKILASNGFKDVLSAYLKEIKNRKSNIYRYLCNGLGQDSDMLSDVINLFKLLNSLKASEIIKLSSRYEKILNDKDSFIKFIEDIYGFWRKIERYTIVHSSKKGEGFENVSFIDANNNFSKLVLNLYRKVEENVIGYKPNVYRQLPAGGNAGLTLVDMNFSYPQGYEKLNGIPFIDSILLDPPFIIYPKKNTRDGFFSEVFENPLKKANMNKEHWFCYPAKVGSLLAYIYFHRDFMAHGITLCNLFELARIEEIKGKKPDIIYIFGGRDDNPNIETVFYNDEKNDIMLGYVNYNEGIDYFGYMKKMTLTLHNLIMIKRGCLPIHGSMVNIVMKNKKSANVIIMGDSGAGKSESLEAFRKLSEEYISDMTIIFDDMGVLKYNKEGKPLAFGTEVGAFVRLDDLDPGYAFREIDRSIFMNPDKTNARLVIPVSTYKDITKGYPVDLFLYANNYEDGPKIEYFNDTKSALKVFKTGARIAKGTTTEKGLVKTYFANPFGPYQRQKETDKLLDLYFDDFFKKGVKVGQIRTCLGIKGKEKTGPIEAALKLFEEIKKL